MNRPLCFIDTETTSLREDREAWEVAIIRRDVDGAEDTWVGFLRVNLLNADSASLAVGGFYDRHPTGRRITLADAPDDCYRLQTPGMAAERISWMTHGATIVGAIPWFDTLSLTRILVGERIIPSWHHRLRCVESMTAGHLGRDVGGLAACAAALEVEPGPAHQALGDATTAMRIYDKLMGAAS